jgi:hypothetical protein
MINMEKSRILVGEVVSIRATGLDNDFMIGIRVIANPIRVNELKIGTKVEITYELIK